MSVRNWSGTVEFAPARVVRPRSIEEVRIALAQPGPVKVLGSAHSFNRIADTSGTLLRLDDLPRTAVIDSGTRSVRVSAAMRYGELAQRLHAEGFALANLASLPHISVAGAVATGTHGSGVRNPSMAAAVSSLTMILADGSTRTLRRGQADFDGAVIGLGALGVVVELELDIEESFDVEQIVYEDLRLDAVLSDFDTIVRLGYSVSLFTRLRAPASVDMCWLKRRPDRDAEAPEQLAGGSRASRQRHPIPGGDVASTTEQGSVGAWLDRLPHFRAGFTPSAGEEIQSEYFVPRSEAASAIEAIYAHAEGLAPVVQACEIRTVAADELWLSAAYRRDVVGLHFTWRREPRAVLEAASIVEQALAPLVPCAHWGKVTSPGFRNAPRFERMNDFRALVERLDPDGRFGNEFLRATLES